MARGQPHAFIPFVVYPLGRRLRIPFPHFLLTYAFAGFSHSRTHFHCSAIPTEMYFLFVCWVSY